VHWGCGANCIEWAVIDLQDGAVWFAPDFVASCVADEPDDEHAPSDWFETHLESRLFYLYECSTGIGPANHAFDVRRVYEWRDGRPVLLRTEPIRGRRPS
jgi:hypothetical protein